MTVRHENCINEGIKSRLTQATLVALEFRTFYLLVFFLAT
jgi:hypothetical protein